MQDPYNSECTEYGDIELKLQLHKMDLKVDIDFA